MRKTAKKILDALGCPEGELSLLIVDNAQIQQLNREYLQRDRPTNVLSFAMQEGAGQGVQPQLLGDVVISAERAAADAADAQVSFESELVFLLLHGILHLLGFDHERGSDADARLMEAKEEQIFALLHNDILALAVQPTAATLS